MSVSLVSVRERFIQLHIFERSAGLGERTYRWSFPGFTNPEAVKLFTSFEKELKNSTISIRSLNLHELMISLVGRYRWKFIPFESSNVSEFMSYSLEGWSAQGNEKRTLENYLIHAQTSNKAVSFLYDAPNGKRRVHVGFVHSLAREHFTIVSSEGYFTFRYERVVSFAKLFDKAPLVPCIEVREMVNPQSVRFLHLSLDARYRK